MDVSRETIDRLQNYQSLLTRWNKKINLVANSDIDIFWSRHIMDSLQLMNYIGNKNIHLIDTGSGSGLPGIILSIAGVRKVTLIESDVRKSAFLLQAAKISDNEISVINDRVEKLDKLECDILTARAFAGLKNIFMITKDIKIKDKYLLLKGKNWQQEVIEAKKDWLFEPVIHDSITSVDSKILEIGNVSSRIQ